MMARCDAAEDCTGADNGGRHWLIATAVLAVHAGLVAYSGYVHSPTLNEPAHLAAGISHWQFGRFELYRVNPPLVRMIAALPVLAAGAETDWRGFYEGPGARPEMAINDDFVAANGRRTFWLVTLARWACIALSLVGGVVCFLWGRALYGGRAGLVAMVLWCFSPNILAHGALITADLGATALGLAAAYLFWQWLKEPCWSRAVGAGLALGLAELTKTTWIVLFPLWPALWLFWRGSRWAGRGVQTGTWPRQTVQLAAIFCLAVYVLNLGYGFEGSMTRLGDYQFVSRVLASAEPPEGNVRPSRQRPGNRFAGTFLAAVPVPLPKNYVVGIDVQRRDFERSGWPSYLRGVLRHRGWWYYYLYALAMKVPLGTWAILLLVILLRGRHPRPSASGATPCSLRNPNVSKTSDVGTGGQATSGTQRGDYATHVSDTGGQATSGATSQATTGITSQTTSGTTSQATSGTASQATRGTTTGWPDEVVLLAPAAVVLVLVSCQTGLNHHMRYALPALPAFFIWASQLATMPIKKRVTPSDGRPPRCIGARIFSSCRFHPSSFLFAAALLWSVASSLRVYPHSLSYFNELAGGPTGGHAHLIHSNIDWGQDLLYLKRWLAGHPEARPLYLAYYGPVGPHHLGIDYRLPPVADTCTAVPHLKPGWYAVSVNFLRGYPYHVYDEKGQRQSLPMGALGYFLKLRPVVMAGYSIYIYHVPPGGAANGVARFPEQ